MRLIAVLVILAGGNASLASDCVRSRAVYQTYQIYAAPTYYTPYQYTPPYYYPSYAATVYVPKVLEVEVQKDHYYSISPAYYEGQTIDKIAALLKQEREGNQGQQPVTQIPPPQPVQPAPQIQRQTIAPPVQQAQVLGRLPLFLDRNRPSAYQNPDLVKMVQTSCVKCHAAEQKMPLLTPDGKSLLDLTKCAALDVYFRCNTGDMPKTAPPIDDKFMPLLAEWARQSK